MCPLLFPSLMAMGQKFQLMVNRQTLPFQQRLQSLVWKTFGAFQNPTLLFCYKWKEQWEAKAFWRQTRHKKNGLSDTYTTSILGELLKCSESQFLNL